MPRSQPHYNYNPNTARDAGGTANNPFGQLPPPPNQPPGGTYPSPYALGSIYKGYQMAANGYAGLIGPLSTAQATTLFNNNVSVSEFNQRLQAVQRAYTNQAVFDQAAIVARADKINIKLDTVAERAAAIMSGGEDFWKWWDEAATRGAAVNAGFGIVGPKGGNDLALTRANIQSIQSSAGLEGPTSGKLDQQLAKNLGTLADLSSSIGPLSRYAGLNISKSNLIDMLFGGPTQESTKQQVNQLLTNAKAASEQAPAEPTFRPAGVSAASGPGAGLTGQEQA